MSHPQPFVSGHPTTTLAQVRAAATCAGNVVETWLVLKRAPRQEAAAMRAFLPLSAAAPALPELVAEGVDDQGGWILMPRYDGRTAPSAEDVPSEVFDSLAHLHAAWHGRTEALVEVPAIDMALWRGLCVDYTLPILRSAREASAHDTVDAAIAVVEATGDDERIAAALDLLPRTLVHGDVHQWNVILHEPVAKLVDWGNARRGPAMLDVVGVAEHGSANECRYLTARERIAGHALDADLMELECAWARVQEATQWLAYLAAERPRHELAAALDRRSRTFADLEEALLRVRPRAR